MEIKGLSAGSAMSRQHGQCSRRFWAIIFKQFEAASCGHNNRHIITYIRVTGKPKCAIF